MEDTVTSLLKATTVFAAACVVLLPSLPANAKITKAAVRQQCREQVKVRYPSVTTESRRTVGDLYKACVKNGGTIPG
jgi:hypothetical protein